MFLKTITQLYLQINALSFNFKDKNTKRNETRKTTFEALVQ